MTNYQHTEADEDVLNVAALVGSDKTVDADELQRIKAIALVEPMLVPTLLAPDGSVAGINVFLTLPDGDTASNTTVVQWADAALAPPRSRYPHFDILIGGTVASNVAVGQAVERDLSTLVAMSYATVIALLLLLLLLRRITSVVATMLVVTLLIAATMGVFGWLGATLAGVAGFVPSIIMTVAVADAVHLLATFHYEARRGASREAAVAEALRTNAAPILVTSVTTAIGVLTLNFSDSPPYRDLGNMVAAGVLAAYLLSMTFLPALLLWLPMRHTERGAGFEQLMSHFADWVIAHHRRLLLVVGAAIVVVASFIPRNVMTERWHEYFDDTFAVRETIDAIDRHQGYLHVIRYALDTGEDHGVNDPAYLADVERFSNWYRSQPEVVHTLGLTDIVKRLNKNLHGDDPVHYRVPTGRDETAQYLLLYELSLPQGLGLDTMIDMARSKSQFLVFVKRTDSAKLVFLDERAQGWATANLTAFDIDEGTGIDMVFAHINHRNIRGLLKGKAFALVLISLLLVVVLRSLRLGLLSLVTNLAPAGLAYGLWGMFNGYIDLSASIVMCMSLGIVVDDTVHFLSKYLRARRIRGLSVEQSMRYTFNTVGVALCTTTAVLVSGVAVLAFSHFSPSVVTGSLLAITLAFALVVDLLFMPALLIVLGAHLPKAV